MNSRIGIEKCTVCEAEKLYCKECDRKYIMRDANGVMFCYACAMDTFNQT